MWKPNKSPVPDYDATQTKERFERGEVQLIDVREPDEWDEAHIEGARWIPLGELQRRYTELDPNVPWVAVCHAGGRSARAADFLHDAGYNVANMTGGMMGWAAKRYPMVEGRGDGGKG